MAKLIPALVEPSVLRWARESVNYTTLAASRKLAVAEDKLQHWEAGEGAPTIAQLRKMAEVYKRPLGVFYLPQPPTDFDAMRDFRRHVGATAGAWSPELHTEYRRAISQRESALELAEIEEVPPPTDWQLAILPDGDEGWPPPHGSGCCHSRRSPCRGRTAPSTTTSTHGARRWKRPGCW